MDPMMNYHHMISFLPPPQRASTEEQGNVETIACSGYLFAIATVKEDLQEMAVLTSLAVCTWWI